MDNNLLSDFDNAIKEMTEQFIVLTQENEALKKDIEFLERRIAEITISNERLSSVNANLVANSDTLEAQLMLFEEKAGERKHKRSVFKTKKS